MPRPVRTDTRVDLTLTALCVAASVMFLILPDSARDRTAAALRTTIVAPLAAMQVRAELSRRAFLLHDGAARLADSVSLRSQRLGGVEDENAQLRALLGLAGAVKWGFVPAEVLHGRGVGDDFTVTLSAGASAGVEVLSPVIAPEGVVGVVERADQSLSQAVLWPHAEFRISAMSVDGAAYGIVNSHPGRGAERYYLELRGVTLRSPLKVGSLVVSSGQGGVFPRGIPIGTVVAELKATEGWARSYLLRPAVKFTDISSVMILKPTRAAAGLEGVWEVPASADSATKRLAAVGDSLRKAAAARDSIKRVTVVRDSLKRVP